jgi:hypothetical protein
MTAKMKMKRIESIQYMLAVLIEEFDPSELERRVP